MPSNKTWDKTTVMPVQARRGDGRTPGSSIYSCSFCKIDYSVTRGQNAVCPLCDLREESESLRKQIGALAQENEMLRDDLERSERRSNLAGTLGDALDLADFEDLAMLKAIAYRWRADQETFRVTVVRPQGRAKLEMRPDHERREYFEPSSVGGVAFVETFEDLIKSQGHVKAMEYYAQAIAHRLAS